jgi:hypothetical protein
VSFAVFWNFDRRWRRPRIRLRKYRACGMIIAAFSRRPMIDSRSSSVTTPCAMHVRTSRVHAWNLSSGRPILNVRVQILQPSRIPCSLGPPSALSLSSARKRSRGIGSSVARGRLRMWIARGTAAGVRRQFSDVSRKTVVKSSTKQSTFPSGQAGGSRASGRAAPNGTVGGRRIGCGTKCCIGLWHIVGSHSLQAMRSLARSVTISDAVHQVGGQPDPPNDNLSSINARLSCVAMH